MDQGGGDTCVSLPHGSQQRFTIHASENLLYEDLCRCEGLLSTLTAEEIAQRFEQRLERARILAAAGALIIQVVMQYLHVIRVSSHGVREGVLLAYTRYGEHWLEEVNSIASKRGKSQAD
jgi:exopolyphosphatase/pppGpp-phosphohydrolase